MGSQQLIDQTLKNCAHSTATSLCFMSTGGSLWQYTTSEDASLSCVIWQLQISPNSCFLRAYHGHSYYGHRALFPLHLSMVNRDHSSRSEDSANQKSFPSALIHTLPFVLSHTQMRSHRRRVGTRWAQARSVQRLRSSPLCQEGMCIQCMMTGQRGRRSM